MTTNHKRFLDPPEIEVERVWVHSGEGNEALLVCIVNAEPHAEVNIIIYLPIILEQNQKISLFI